MGCKISEEQLWSWIDRKAPELEEHLAVCPECRARAEEMRMDIGFLAPEPSGADFPLPQKVGPYRIKKLIGEGGQALVYEAEQASPLRAVALKMLKGGCFVSKKHLKHFRREAHVLASLKHPRIATIYEAGHTDEGQHYFVMELVAGVPLDTYTKERDLARKDRLTLFCKICEAVDYAHKRGVIHRDLKPSNILIEEDGEPKILDFGLAQLTGEEPGLSFTATESVLIAGTPRYMSPEQARGKREKIDARTDVYSLGVLLYELLTGQPPYKIASLSPHVMQTICEEEPRKPSSINRELRGDIETIILKALEKDVSRRYPSVAALAEDIRRYLATEPILARPPSGLYLLRKKISRHRAWVVIGVVAIILASTGIWRALQPPYDRQRARREILNIQCELFHQGHIYHLHLRAKGLPARYHDIPEALMVSTHADYVPDLRRAIDNIEEALKNEPSFLPYEIMLAEIRTKPEQRTSEISLFSEGNFDIPKSAEDCYVMSFAMVDVDRALLWLRETLKREPGHLLALEGATLLCDLTGDVQGALEGATTLIELGSLANHWRSFKSSLFSKRKQYPEALEVLNELVFLQPNSQIYLTRRSAILRRLGQYESAASDLSKTIELSKRERPAAWWFHHRATVHWILGEHEMAIADYKTAYRLLAHTTFGNARLFLILHELGRTEEAERVLADARENVWEDPWLAKVLACLDRELTPDQLVDTAQTISLKRLCEAYYYAGEVCLQQGQSDSAQNWFRKCVQTGLDFDLDEPGYKNPMSEYELAEWRLKLLLFQ